MRTRLKLKPGQKGTRKLVAQYGKQLVCVRYRYDAQKQKRYKTIELIVDEIAWKPRPSAETLVGLKVALDEIDVRRQVKEAGGKWNPTKKVWELRYDQVVKLGLTNRMTD
jgi:hypothetical protein